MRSFRVRLIVAFVALFTAISVAVSFLGLLVREQQTVSLFDDALRIRAEDVKRQVLALPTLDDASLERVATQNLPNQRYVRDLFVDVYDESGNSVGHSQNLGDTHIPLIHAVTEASADESIRDRTLEIVGKGTVYTRSIRKSFQRPGEARTLVALVAANADDVRRSIGELRLIFLGGNLAGLLAATGAAWLVTGAMAKRIETIKQQVQALGPDELSRRIEMHSSDEISELAVHLNAMLDRLKAGFETQERFIHDASHELKTPVATIQAEAQALMLGEPSREEMLGFVHATNDEMRRLGRLIEALLLLTRTNEARAARRFRTMDLAEITTGAIRHLSALATDHKIHLNLVQPQPAGESLLVRCDPDLLEAMISNLIRNAIRFSPQRSEVRITLQGNDTAAELLVEDAGPGIPQDILPHLFDRYFESSQTRVRRGAGLGLAIALTVVNLHGGSITATNRVAHGACFTVRLPRHLPAPVGVTAG